MNRTRAIRMAAALAAAAACGEGTGPKPGSMVVALTGQVPARSVQFQLVGAQTGVTAASANVRVFSSPHGGDTLMVAVVANPGHTLSEGNLVTVAVPDVAAAKLYTLTVRQIAAADYSLQNSSGYVLTILQN